MIRFSTKVLNIGYLRGEFNIAREKKIKQEHVFITAHAGEVMGIGESLPSAYYGGENVQSVLSVVEAANSIISGDLGDISGIMSQLVDRLSPGPAACCGIETALYDLKGKLSKKPVYDMLGLDPGGTPATSFTIDIGEPGEMARWAVEAAKQFRVLKIKVGTPRDEEILRSIRGTTDVTLRLDANTAWTKQEAVEKINRLDKYDIEFVEQPVPPGDNNALRFVKERVSVPVMADESCVNMASLVELVGCVDMVNIKLMKCGGISEAERMIRFAENHNIPVMLGCMTETSVGITAAAHLSPMVKYADLDGNLLLSNDPYRGVTISGGRLILPEGPGLGVVGA